MRKRRNRDRESRSIRWIDAQIRSKRSAAVSAVISNISNSGCCIRSSFTFELGERVEIMVPRLGSMSAHIRWQHGKHAGAQFIVGSDSWLMPDPELMAMQVGAAIHASPGLAD